MVVPIVVLLFSPVHDRPTRGAISCSHRDGGTVGVSRKGGGGHCWWCKCRRDRQVDYLAPLRETAQNRRGREKQDDERFAGAFGPDVLTAAVQTVGKL